MMQNKATLLEIPESVKRDTQGFRAKLADFLAGNSSEAAFRAYRVPMGIYEHRSKGDYMARIRIAGGLIAPFQMKEIARISRQYGDGVVHITTRQDTQIHKISIENLADVLEELLEAGLSTRGGGGNTVRNISACPMAGICPNQKFNVVPHSIALTEYMLKSNDSFNLPRKYKLAFSGCSNDCAYASVADLGFFAHIKDGVKGFAVYGGGGMGANPTVAIKLEDFIDEGEIFIVAQTIKEIFDKYGDRSNKHKARLRYVLQRMGEQKFTELYRQKKQQIKSQSPPQFPAFRDIGAEGEACNSLKDVCDLPGNILKQNKEGLFTIRLCLKTGSIPGDDLIKAAEIAEQYSFGFLRTTQSQDILITSVPADRLKNVFESIRLIGIDISGREKANIVTCTGADTCQLGLCLSKGLADAISNRLSGLDVPKEAIRISGCPNSCGQHHIAQIGLQGRAKRIGDKMLPCYQLLIGGKAEEGKSKFGKIAAMLPAKDIPDFLYDVFAQKAIETGKLEDIITQYEDFSRDFPEGYFYDYGADEPFSLKGRGPGECGAGVLDVIKMDIDEAKNLLAETAKPDDEKLYKAVIFVSRALLILYGHEPKKDREVLKLFKEHLIDLGYVKPETEKLFETVIDWKLGDIDSLAGKADEIKELAERVEELFLSLDSTLKFQLPPLNKTPQSAEDVSSESREVDLRGVLCPLNFVKAKLELEKVQIGQSLCFLLDDGEPAKNVPGSFTNQGQEVLRTDKRDGYYVVEVRRNR